MVIEYFLDWIAKAPVPKRVESAEALVRAYLRHDVEPQEREDIEAALTILLDDSSALVRIAMANTFSARPDAPRHIISTLASDVIDVSIIVLSRSPIFHDSELVDFIVNGEIDKQIAIACRPWLSDKLLSAICEKGCEEACMGVLANPVSDFSYEDMHMIASRFGDRTDMRSILLERTDLAAETRLLLIGKLSSSLSSFVSGKEWMSEERMQQIASEAHDKAAVTFAATVSDEEVVRIARSLIENDQMNVSFLLRSVCMGNITLAASVISELSGVRFAKVESILTKDRRSAFKAVYKRAGLPHAAFDIFATAISTWRRLLLSGSKINQERMPFLVTQEVLKMYTTGSNEIVDDLMVLLRKLSAEAARDSAKSKAVEISQRAPDIVEKISTLATTTEAVAESDVSFDVELDDLEFEFDAAIAKELLAESSIDNEMPLLIAEEVQEEDLVTDPIADLDVQHVIDPEILVEHLDIPENNSDFVQLLPFEASASIGPANHVLDKIFSKKPATDHVDMANAKSAASAVEISHAA